MTNRQLTIWHSKSEFISPQAQKQQNHFVCLEFQDFMFPKWVISWRATYKKRKRKIWPRLEPWREKHAGYKQQNTTCIKTDSQGNNIIFMHCCQMKSLITPVLVFWHIHIFDYFYFYWRSQNSKAHSKTDRGISGKLTTSHSLLSTYLLGKMSSSSDSSNSRFLLHSQFCKRTNHLSEHWYKTVLYT